MRAPCTPQKCIEKGTLWCAQLTMVYKQAKQRTWWLMFSMHNRTSVALRLLEPNTTDLRWSCTFWLGMRAPRTPGKCLEEGTLWPRPLAIQVFYLNEACVFKQAKYRPVHAHISWDSSALGDLINLMSMCSPCVRDICLQIFRTITDDHKSSVKKNRYLLFNPPLCLCGRA